MALVCDKIFIIFKCGTAMPTRLGDNLIFGLSAFAGGFLFYGDLYEI